MLKHQFMSNTASGSVFLWVHMSPMQTQTLSLEHWVLSRCSLHFPEPEDPSLPCAGASGTHTHTEVTPHTFVGLDHFWW